MRRFLIMLEQTEAGFAVQVPDLAIVTCGDSIAAAKEAAIQAIEANLDGYRQCGQRVPDAQPVMNHLHNPEFQDLLFAYVKIATPEQRIAA